MAGLDGCQKVHAMLIFLDTEFTDFVRPDLISIALVAEDGREFYAERTDYHRDACSGFVRETVLILLDRVPGATCSRAELTLRLRDWFETLPEPATIIYDFEGDWLLLADAYLGRHHRQPPANVGDKLHLDNYAITHPVFEQALNLTYTQDWPPHHALADARALRNGYLTWREQCAVKVTKGLNSIDSSLITLADYPVLAELAKGRTKTVKLDGRACRHIYSEALSQLNTEMLTASERRLIGALGLLLNNEPN